MPRTIPCSQKGTENFYARSSTAGIGTGNREIMSTSAISRIICDIFCVCLPAPAPPPAPAGTTWWWKGMEACIPAITMCWIAGIWEISTVPPSRKQWTAPFPQNSWKKARNVPPPAPPAGTPPYAGAAASGTGDWMEKTGIVKHIKPFSRMP